MRADEIRQARKRQRLTQSALAELVGVSRVTVGEWEAGRQTPTPANLADVARALGEPARAPSSSGPRSDPSEDPSYWAGYLAGISEMIGHGHAMIGTAHQKIGTMLANRASWGAASSVPSAASASAPAPSVVQFAADPPGSFTIPGTDRPLSEQPATRGAAARRRRAG